MNIPRWNPYANTDRAWNELDPVFEETVMRSLSDWPAPTEVDLMIPMDLYDTGEELVVYADLPGVRAEDIQLSLNGHALSVFGEFRTNREAVETGNVYFRERTAGKFQRSIALPAEVDPSRVHSDFSAGVLRVALPKR